MSNVNQSEDLPPRRKKDTSATDSDPVDEEDEGNDRPRRNTSQVENANQARLQNQKDVVSRSRNRLQSSAETSAPTEETITVSTSALSAQERQNPINKHESVDNDADDSFAQLRQDSTDDHGSVNSDPDTLFVPERQNYTIKHERTDSSTPLTASIFQPATSSQLEQEYQSHEGIYTHWTKKHRDGFCRWLIKTIAACLQENLCCIWPECSREFRLKDVSYTICVAHILEMHFRMTLPKHPKKQIEQLGISEFQTFEKAFGHVELIFVKMKDSTLVKGNVWKGIRENRREEDTFDEMEDKSKELMPSILRWAAANHASRYS